MQQTINVLPSNSNDELLSSMRSNTIFLHDILAVDLMKHDDSKGMKLNKECIEQIKICNEYTQLFLEVNNIICQEVLQRSNYPAESEPSTLIERQE